MTSSQALESTIQLGPSASAKECRLSAKSASADEIRAQFVDLAARWNQLADDAEKIEKIRISLAGDWDSL